MKNIKRILAVTVSVFIIGAAGMAYAADIKTPADIAAAVTGKSATDISKERAEGKTYGAIASEAGKLDDFKAQMLDQKKAVLDQRVKDGEITQAQADDIYNAIINNQANCNADGSSRMGRKYGMGLGRGCGNGSGRGQGLGCGMGLND